MNKGKTKQGLAELKMNYKFDGKTNLLGEGSFGKVFKSHNLSDPSIKVAIKQIDKSVVEGDLRCLMDEIEIISMLDHPNIVHF